MQMEVLFPGGKRVNALYRGFTISTDQSMENGGEGSAPTPFDLFLASLATCAGIYVLSFCRHRDIPTDRIRLIQRTDRNPETKLIDRIAVEIRLPPDFPEKYRQAVVRAAELCTVKKVLERPPEFTVLTRVMSE